MLRIFFWLMLTVTVVLCGNVRILDMGNGEIISLAMTGCNYRICPLRNGDIYNINMTFVANQNSNVINIGIWSIINGTSTPVPIGLDGCAVDELDNIEPQCPIRKGRTYSVTRKWTGVGLIPGTTPVIIGQWFGDRGQILFQVAKYTVVE